MPDGPARAGLLARNSLANLVRVASTSLVALLIPVVLVTVLRPDLYAVWALLFGLAGFVLYLDFGLPASVQAMTARATADEHPDAARTTAVSGVGWALAISIVLLGGLAVFGASAADLFPAVGGRAGGEVVGVVLLVGAGNLATLVGNTAAAYFAGLQRSAVAAAVLVPGRVASLLIAVPVAVATQDLLLVAAAYAVPLVVGAAVMVRMTVRGGFRRARALPLREHARVVQFSGPLAAWSVYMLCISGAGILIVGRVDFRAVAIFSLSTAFAAAITGVQSALVSPVLSELGRAFGRGDRVGADDLVLSATGLNAAFVAVGVVGVEALFLVVAPVLDRSHAVAPGEALLIVALVALAAGVRLTMSPLTFAFVASGSHRRLLLPPAAEAAVTLLGALVLGAILGAVGVALGLLVGASSGVVVALTWSRRITSAVGVGGAPLALRGVLRPALAILPAQIVTAIAVLTGDGLGALALPAAVLMVASVGAVAWFRVVPEGIRRTSVLAVLSRSPRVLRVGRA